MFKLGAYTSHWQKIYNSTSNVRKRRIMLENINAEQEKTKKDDQKVVEE